MEKSGAINFTSSYFKVESNEDEKTNPGIYGQALARWIADRLSAKGLVPEEVVPEDWGWCVVVKTKPIRLNVAVSNLDGSSTQWRIFAFAERGLLQLFKNATELKREVSALREQLTAIVETVPDVRDISWESLSGSSSGNTSGWNAG